MAKISFAPTNFSHEIFPKIDISLQKFLAFSFADEILKTDLALVLN